MVRAAAAFENTRSRVVSLACARSERVSRVCRSMYSCGGCVYTFLISAHAHTYIFGRWKMNNPQRQATAVNRAYRLHFGPQLTPRQPPPSGPASRHQASRRKPRPAEHRDPTISSGSVSCTFHNQ